MEFISQNINYILIGLAVLVLVLFVLVIVLFRKYIFIKNKFDKLTKSTNEEDATKILMRLSRDIKDLENSNVLREERINNIESTLKQACIKLGFVRYDAFNRTGEVRSGELSYSICLLDSYNNGIIITSIFGANSSTNYAKRIENLKSNIPLSEEELIALERAK